MCDCSKAYDEGTEEKYRHLVMVDDGSLDHDSSRTSSLDFSFSDSNTVTDDSTSRGLHDLIEINMYLYVMARFLLIKMLPPVMDYSAQRI